MRCAVVGAAVWIAHGMGQLVLNKIGADSKYLVKNGPRCRSKAVSTHLIFRDVHAAQRGKDGVVTHRPLIAARSGENVASAAGKWLEFAKGFECLSGEWDDVRCVGFCYHKPPFCSVKIKVGPFGLAKLS